MIARLIEDAFFVGRFAWFYYKAPSQVHSLGFYVNKRPVPMKVRAKYAYQMAAGVNKQVR